MSKNKKRSQQPGNIMKESAEKSIVIQTATMMKTKAGGSPEYLSQDILDEDFVATFKTFHKFQYFLGSCRVEAKDQFVTSPTRYQKAYTILCIIGALVSDILLMLSVYEKQAQDLVIFFLTVFTMCHAFTNCLCVVVNVRFFSGQDNADFFVQMQKVDRAMGLDKVKELNLILKKIQSFSLFGMVVIFVVAFIVASTNMKIYYLSSIGAIYGQLTGMVELMYCSDLIIYFYLRVRFINCIIKNHLNQDKKTNKKRTFNEFSNRNIKLLALKSHSFQTSDTHVHLKELFDLFTIFQNLYRFQILIFCLKLVFESVCAFGIVLFSVQRKNAVDIMESVSQVLFTIADIFIAVLIGVRLQLFFSEVKETKRVSIAVMAKYCTGRLREKARRMLKIANETPPRMSIYDMYDMQARTFLSIFSLITSLIVTLLQFAFL